MANVRATLGATADLSHPLTRGNSKIYQKQEDTPEPWISPNKGKSKDKSLENPLLGEPYIYTTDAQKIREWTIENETILSKRMELKPLSETLWNHQGTICIRRSPLPTAPDPTRGGPTLYYPGASEQELRTHCCHPIDPLSSLRRGACQMRCDPVGGPKGKRLGRPWSVLGKDCGRWLAREGGRDGEQNRDSEEWNGWSPDRNGWIVGPMRDCGGKPRLREMKTVVPWQ